LIEIKCIVRHAQPCAKRRQLSSRGAQLPTLLRGVYYEHWRPMTTIPGSDRNRANFLARVDDALYCSFGAAWWSSASFPIRALADGLANETDVLLENISTGAL
jgi:hypothetical protein